jgi:hypothetical protein
MLSNTDVKIFFYLIQIKFAFHFSQATAVNHSQRSSSCRGRRTSIEAEKKDLIRYEK